MHRGAQAHPIRSVEALSIRSLVLVVAGALAVAGIALAPPALAQAADDVPMWAYPSNIPGATQPPDDGIPRRVPDSSATYTMTQLRDRFLAPDWHPQEHRPMPDVVRGGRPPDVAACGYCHRATGTGGPENANIAGLPYAYIVRQLREYRSGTRTTAVPGRGPTTLMIAGARAATDAEIDAAAAYFSALAPVVRIRVEESATAPRLFVTNWIWAVAPGDETEPLGLRIVEIPEDLEQFEARDPHARFVAYVPPGSIARGESLARTGAGKTLPCAVCHGAKLKGTSDIPPIAGRSPTYVVRQLFEFKAGFRRGAMSGQMLPVVASLSVGDMIDLAAYLATQAL